MDLRVTGVGHTRFGVLDQTLGDLMESAVREAIADAGLTVADIDVAYIANFSDSFVGQCHLPALLSDRLDREIEATRVESACASGGLAFKEAVLALKSGMYRTALVVGVEKMTQTAPADSTRILAGAASPQEIEAGATFPGLFALMARAHFEAHGTSEEQLAAVATKNHANALRNPLAHFQKDISAQDVLASRPVASPLKLLDCSPLSDGAAAVIVTSDPGADGIMLRGIGHASTDIRLYRRPDLASMPSVEIAGQRAYEMAGLSPDDIDVAEIHDCFTIAEVIQTEELGFCARGAGGSFAASGATSMGGRIPLNPSGGLKAKGHPVGATGVSQIVEVVKQLRGVCGDRQVKDAGVGLCCNIGGSGSSAVVSIFSR